jgi:hypothetical protein
MKLINSFHHKSNVESSFPNSVVVSLLVIRITLCDPDTNEKVKNTFIKKRTSSRKLAIITLYLVKVFSDSLSSQTS